MDRLFLEEVAFPNESSNGLATRKPVANRAEFGDAAAVDEEARSGAFSLSLSPAQKSSVQLRQHSPPRHLTQVQVSTEGSRITANQQTQRSGGIQSAYCSQNRSSNFLRRWALAACTEDKRACCSSATGQRIGSGKLESKQHVLWVYCPMRNTHTADASQPGVACSHC